MTGKSKPNGKEKKGKNANDKPTGKKQEKKGDGEITSKVAEDTSEVGNKDEPMEVDDTDKEDKKVVDYKKLTEDAQNVQKEFTKGEVLNKDAQNVKEGFLDGEQIKKKSQDVKPERMEHHPKQPQKTNINMFVIAAILVVILAVYCISFSHHTPAKNLFVMKSVFKQNLKNLEAEFTNQSKDLWAMVGKLGMDHIDDVTMKGNAIRPLVFLMVSSVENNEMLSCMARKIAKSFTNGDNIGEKHPSPVIMDGNEFANVVQSKDNLDKELEDKLDNDGNGVVVITKIGTMSYETASIFFKYCDNEGAPYPNVVFIFTLALPEGKNLQSQSSKELNRATWHHLRSVVWSNGYREGIDPLIARIVDPRPIPVLSEEDSVVKKCLAG
eukprot:gene15700-17284_t